MKIGGVEGQRLRLAVGVLLLALGLAFALARLGPIREIGALRTGAPWFMVDFRHVVYYPTLAFWEGLNPYDSSGYMERYPVDIPVSMYPPATFLVFAPLALMPVEVASAVYFILTVVLTLVLGWAALRLSGWRPAVSTVLGVGGLLLLTRPGHWNLLSGQVTVIVVLSTYTAWTFARRAPRLAGTALGLALLKPTFGVPLLPILLAQRANRAVAWGLGLAAALNIPILLVLVRREGGLNSFLGTAAQSVRAFRSNPDGHPIKAVWRVDLTACISRLVNYPLELTAELLLTAVVLVAVIVMSRRLVKSDSSDHKRILDGLVCCSVLLSLYHQAYDLLLLTLPAAALARVFYKGYNPGTIGVAQALLFAVLSLNYFATQSVLKAFALTPGPRLAVISANGLALTGLFVLYAVEAHRLTGFSRSQPA